MVTILGASYIFKTGCNKGSWQDLLVGIFVVTNDGNLKEGVTREGDLLVILERYGVGTKVVISIGEVLDISVGALYVLKPSYKEGSDLSLSYSSFECSKYGNMEGSLHFYVDSPEVLEVKIWNKNGIQLWAFVWMP